MAVLVTGGAGYIGSHTCVELLNAGYEIVVVDNFSNSCPEVLNRIKKITGKSFRFYEADLCDINAIDKILKENSIGSVIHFAGLKAVGESVDKPLMYYENNVGMTFNLCRKMKEYKVEKIVFSSSATVYGDAEHYPVSENAPVAHATCPYGETKIMIERILADLHHAGDLKSVMILRYFNPIGAHESGLIGESPNGIPNNLLPFVTQVAVGKRKCLSIFGNDYPTPDGTGIRDYIHVVDLAKAHIKALERAYKSDNVEYYNLGTGTGYSVLDLVKTFEKATGKKIPYVITDRRPGDIAVNYADPSKALQILGWKAEYDLERMCRDSDRWQSMNPEGYGND